LKEQITLAVLVSLSWDAGPDIAISFRHLI